MVKPTKFTWMGYLEEPAAYYAGGNGGTAALEMKKCQNRANLIALDRPVLGTQPIMPYRKYVREEVREIGDGEADVTILDKDYQIINGSIETYIQTLTWLKKAIYGVSGSIPSHATQGSFLMHWQPYSKAHAGSAADERRWETYGNLVHKIVLKGTAGDFPSQIIGIMPYDMKSEIAAGTIVDSFAKVEFSSAAIKTFKDFVIRVDNNNLNKTEFTLTIENFYDLTKEFGRFGIAEPRLNYRKITFDLTYKTDTLDLLIEDSLNNATVDKTRAITVDTGITNGLITCTNMYATKSNVQELPSFGFYSHKLTFEQAENFSITIN